MAYYETDLPTVVNGGNGNCNNGGFFGNDGFWAGIIGLIAVAAIFGGNGGGLFGGGNNRSVDAAIQRGFDTQTVVSKLDGINTGLCDGFYAMNTGMLNGFSGVQSTLCQGFSGTQREVANLGYQLQSCCCDLSRQIDGVNYNMAKNTCDITNAINGSTQQILGYLCNEKISALQAENSLLTAQLSQNSQTNTIINALRPVAQPAYITCSPFESAYGFYGNRSGYGNNCGCGCGCGCNG